MTPDDVTNAIVNAILHGGEQWIVSTIAAMLPSLWAMTVIMHLARPYMLRTVKKLSLRFGADVWWLSYVLVRDGIMLTTFALGLIFLFPNLDLTIPLPLTAPLDIDVLPSPEAAVKGPDVPAPLLWRTGGQGRIGFGYLTGISLALGCPSTLGVLGTLISSTPWSYAALISLSRMPLGSDMCRSKVP